MCVRVHVRVWMCVCVCGLDVSPENSMEDSVFDNSGVLPCSKPRLLHLQSLESGQEMNPEVRETSPQTFEKIPSLGTRQICRFMF